MAEPNPSAAEQARPASGSRSELIRWMNITDANGAGFVHGGVVMRMCDEVAGIAAIRHCGARVVTAGMDRMTFSETVYVGELIRCIASVNAVWRTSMEVGVRVEAENAVTRRCAARHLPDDGGGERPREADPGPAPGGLGGDRAAPPARRPRHGAETGSRSARSSSATDRPRTRQLDCAKRPFTPILSPAPMLDARSAGTQLDASDVDHHAHRGRAQAGDGSGEGHRRPPRLQRGGGAARA